MKKITLLLTIIIILGGCSILTSSDEEYIIADVKHKFTLIESGELQYYYEVLSSDKKIGRTIRLNVEEFSKKENFPIDVLINMKLNVALYFVKNDKYGINTVIIIYKN